MKTKLAAIFLIALMCITATACQSKIAPLDESTFVDDRKVHEVADLPFQKVWKKPGVAWDSYDFIYIAPVCTTCLSEPTWEDARGRGKYIQEDVIGIAQYMQEAFEEAFQDDKRERFVVLEEPENGTLVLELAIVELVPNKALVNLGWYLLGPWTPSLREKAEKVLSSRSRIAMEGRVRDHNTGEVVAMFTDREARKIAFVSINNYTWYGHVKSIIREWAKQMVRIANKVPGEVIKDSSSFTLKPW